MLPIGEATGLSTPLGRLVILASMVAALVVLARWWWHQRKR